MKKQTALATGILFLMAQTLQPAERFQTFAMQGASQTKVINVAANEIAQFIFVRVPAPKVTAPQKIFHKVTLAKGGQSADFTMIDPPHGSSSFNPAIPIFIRRNPDPPLGLGTLIGPGMESGGIDPAAGNGVGFFSHILGKGPIIVGPATLTFANTADATATHKAAYTIRFIPNPNIKNVGQ